MSIIDRLKGLLSRKPAVSHELELIFVRLPEPLEPNERGDRYEDPLNAELQLADLGEVSGGGAQLSELRADGSRSIEWCGIDVDTTDVRRALTLLRRELPHLGCHTGTTLDYTLEGVELSDTYNGEGWAVGQPRASSLA